jgi:hypothetical protein
MVFKKTGMVSAAWWCFSYLKMKSGYGTIPATDPGGYRVQIFSQGQSRKTP